MKKICFFLLVAMLAFVGTSAYAAQVDLQVRNAYVYKFTDGNNPGYWVEFLRVVVQNNGPDDFVGEFSISASDGNKYGSQNFVGVIKSKRTADISVIGSPTKNPYRIFIDPDRVVAETNEDNNFFYFDRNEPQVAITESWTGIRAEETDTLAVLPGEYFYSQFSLQEFGSKSIIGIKYEMFGNGFTGNSTIDFGVQTTPSNDLYGGAYSSRDKDYYYLRDYSYPKTTFSWMANSPEAVLDYWWLGNFSGDNVPASVGEVKDIYLFAEAAVLNSVTNKTSSIWMSLRRSIKTVDRIRGDVNDDGVVDQADVDILTDVEMNGLYNPCMYSAGLYQEKGMNYGAGCILFSSPDFVSNCLLNIWVHNPKDPVVQGLGIGEMMSSRFQSAVQKVANSFSISGSELTIDAPEAEVFNVSAIQADGQLFQKTGRMGEKIVVPDPELKYSVETLRLKNSTAITKLFLATVQKDLVTVRSTKINDRVEISGSGLVTIVNLKGQEMFSGNLQDESLEVASSHWSAGVYILKASSKEGVQTMKLIK